MRRKGNLGEVSTEPGTRGGHPWYKQPKKGLGPNFAIQQFPRTGKRLSGASSRGPSPEPGRGGTRGSWGPRPVGRGPSLQQTGGPHPGPRCVVPGAPSRPPSEVPPEPRPPGTPQRASLPPRPRAPAAPRSAPQAPRPLPQSRIPPCPAPGEPGQDACRPLSGGGRCSPCLGLTWAAGGGRRALCLRSGRGPSLLWAQLCKAPRRLLHSATTPQ